MSCVSRNLAVCSVLTGPDIQPDDSHAGPAGGLLCPATFHLLPAGWIHQH